jgi:Ca2+-binding EF-hand superfamily protein
LCFLLPPAALAQTMVPKLDQDGRKGDVARLAKQKAAERFAILDKDRDGKLSRPEVEQDSAYLTERFPQRDLNSDGYLDWEEFVGHKRWEK